MNIVKNENSRAGRVRLLLAALGVLVMSSGLALTVAAAPANAASECTEQTGWIEVDVNGPTYSYDAPAGKVITDVCAKTGQFPIWSMHLDPPQTSYDFSSADLGWLNNGNPVDLSHIGVKLTDEPEEEPVLASATAAPNTPTCEDNVASYTKSGTNIEDAWQESAAPAFGTTITVTATAVAGAEFEGGATTKSIEITFPPAATGCDEEVPPVVEPPVVEPPVVEPPVVDPPSTSSHTTKTITPTVVEAGIGEMATDLRGEQGLALMVAGLVLVLLAGGLGLVRGRSQV